jgi:membrane carboxypeptidase/penicillin-binding protein
VALAALARGSDGRPAFTLASVLSDEPLSLETPTGLWEPANYGGEFRGTVTLRQAIEDSVNIPFARVGIAIGPEQIVRTAQRMGIEAPLTAVPSLALGTSEVSPLEMAAAYALLANGGSRVEPRSYRAVIDRSGAPIGARPPVAKREFAAAEVAIVTSALQGVVDRGTGHALRDSGFEGPMAGKTGTTNDSRDAWFIGYTPELVAAVWVGFDDGTSLGLTTGSGAALPIFTDFVLASLGREGGADFEEPEGLETVMIEEASGRRAGLFCWGHPELFLTGTAPEERCGPDWFADKPKPSDEAAAHGDTRQQRRRGGSGGGFFQRLRNIVGNLTPGG